MLAAVLFAGSSPTLAQQSDDLDRIREERRSNEAAATEKAGEVNAADAELEEVAAALAAVNAAVNSQQGRVDNAERQLADAEIALADSEQAVADGEALIAGLETQLASSAISSFVSQRETGTVLVEAEDPNLGLRMQTLVEEVTQSGVDLVDSLRRAREDLEVEVGVAEQAATDAEAKSVELAEELAVFRESQGVQADLAAEAEERLNSLLAEQAGLEALGVELAEEERDAQAALAAELARQAPPPTTGGGGGGSAPTAPVTDSSEIVSVGNGIWVHRSIADNIRQLLADAAADGVPLAGGGYRDPAGQIRVRKSNCGTSNYAIYEMPASQCRPPTARPGTSMHERGLAIDFTFNGRIIGRRSGAAWDWLNANAANYGLFNLPSEPWHWSTNGR
jgi:peptidoglycan hydrolase CwlO-like protein